MKIGDFFVKFSSFPGLLIHNFYDSLKLYISGNDRLSLGPLFIFFLIAAIFYLFSNNRKGKKTPANIIKFIFPKEIYSHPSTKMDFKIFLVRIIFDPPKLFSFAFFSYTLAMMVSGYLKNNLPTFGGIIETNRINLFLISLGGFLIYDFTSYFVHRLFHLNPFLWPFHAIHHSAEVLSPYTATRDHFVITIFEHFFMYVFLGLGQGIVIWAFDLNLNPIQIFNFILCLQLFDYIVANFHHSHIWISFGPLDRIFISPALHQVHHSVDLKHRNKNLGFILSIWDWMFGTIYVPKEKEDLVYGIERGVKNPHDTLLKYYFLPFKESGIVIKNKILILWKIIIPAKSEPIELDGLQIKD